MKRRAQGRTGTLRRERGFTLVELLIATAAGLTVSAAAFLLARSASTVFQEETRITGAQLSASLGMRRLASDIERAGLWSTANIMTDPKACKEIATWPPLVANLRAVQILEKGSVLANSAAELQQSIDNGFEPDSITLSGSSGSTEQFPVRTIQAENGSKSVYLETLNGSIKGTCKDQPLANCLPDLERIFQQDRILRITTPSGHQIFGMISGLDLVGNQLKVLLQPAPAVPQVALNPFGYEGDCNYCTASVVSVVRYEIKSLATHPQYGPLVAPVAGQYTGDNGRTELVRFEVGPNGNPIAGSIELVAEFAVDLKFGISSVNQTTTAVTDVPIVLPPDPAVYGTPPERLRSVHVRFSTRARAPDRTGDISPATGPDGRRYRFELPVPSKLKYARLRTLYTEVRLQNLVEVTW